LLRLPPANHIQLAFLNFIPVSFLSFGSKSTDASPSRESARLRWIVEVFLRDVRFVHGPARAAFLVCFAAHFTSTFTRIHGWMQHSKRCSPFDKPVTWSWLPCRIRVLATARFLNPPEHSGAMVSPPLRSSIKPPPKYATTVQVAA